MKPHVIKKAFNGSQNGHDYHEFVPGPDHVLLSDDLAAIVVKEGWAVPVGHPALTRETKVVRPEETKEGPKSPDAMSFKELQAEAKAKGINTFGKNAEKLIAALKAA